MTADDGSKTIHLLSEPVGEMDGLRSLRREGKSRRGQEERVNEEQMGLPCPSLRDETKPYK